MYVSAPGTDLVREIGSGAVEGRATTKRVSHGGVSAQSSMYFDLNDAHQVHSWMRATTAAFGRTVVGPGMTLAKDPFYGDEATREELRQLENFYYGIEGRDFTNLSDWYPFSSKIYRTAGMFRLQGQCMWELRRNGFGEVVSYDIVPGFIFPNCEEDGTFKDPPFTQYVNAERGYELELHPEDVVFFMNPDFGTRAFATDFEALAEYVLPTDIYLTTAMRSLLENLRTPFGVISLEEHATQEEVDTFSRKMDALYRGASNYGKSAIVVRGATDFKTLTPPLKDLPFQQGHDIMKDEVEGISGISGGKLGRTDEVNRSNLREIRRDYWETTHEPVTKMLADQMYVLIHQRVLGIRGWRPVFKAPDFLTQVEKATVGMRGRQWGALNTNEFREFVFDTLPIAEDWADEDYLWPTNMVVAGSEGLLPGEDPLPEPSTDVGAPERGDTNNTEEVRRRALNEMRSYAKFCLNRVGKPIRRTFRFEHVPATIVEMTNEALDEVGDSRDGMKSVFDAVIGGMRDGI
jgi:hypothetical protein